MGATVRDTVKPGGKSCDPPITCMQNFLDLASERQQRLRHFLFLHLSVPLLLWVASSPSMRPCKLLSVLPGTGWGENGLESLMFFSGVALAQLLPPAQTSKERGSETPSPPTGASLAPLFWESQRGSSPPILPRAVQGPE